MIKRHQLDKNTAKNRANRSFGKICIESRNLIVQWICFFRQQFAFQNNSITIDGGGRMQRVESNLTIIKCSASTTEVLHNFRRAQRFLQLIN